MAGLAGSDEWACGHPAQPGARFCPVCGQPAVGRGVRSQPLTAPLPQVTDVPPSAWPPPGALAAAPPPRSEPDPWDSWYAPRRPSSPPPGPHPPDPHSHGPHSSGPQPWPGPPGAQTAPADPGAMWSDGPDAIWGDRPDAMWADGREPAADTPTAMLAGLRATR